MCSLFILKHNLPPPSFSHSPFHLGSILFNKKHAWRWDGLNSIVREKKFWTVTLITSVPSSELVSQISLQHSINVSMKRRKENVGAFIVYLYLSAFAGGSSFKAVSAWELGWFWFLITRFSSHDGCCVNWDATCKTLRPGSDREKKIRSDGQRYQVESCIFRGKPQCRFCQCSLICFKKENPKPTCKITPSLRHMKQVLNLITKWSSSLGCSLRPVSEKTFMYLNSHGAW